MMKYPSPDEYIAAINKPHTSPEVQKLFEYLGLSEEDLKPDELDMCLVVDRDRGFQLTFEDQGVLMDIPYHDVGEGPWILTAVALFAANAIGPNSYAGPLPYGIEFDISRDQLKQAFGIPEVENEYATSWPKNGHELVVNYVPKTQAIKLVGIWALPSR